MRLLLETFVCHLLYFSELPALTASQVRRASTDRKSREHFHVLLHCGYRAVIQCTTKYTGRYQNSAYHMKIRNELQTIKAERGEYGVDVCLVLATFEQSAHMQDSGSKLKGRGAYSEFLQCMTFPTFLDPFAINVQQIITR